jgi:hypothetical protein
MESELAEDQSSDPIRSKTDVGLHKMPSKRQGQKGYLNSFDKNNLFNS